MRAFDQMYVRIDIGLSESYEKFKKSVLQVYVLWYDAIDTHTSKYCKTAYTYILKIRLINKAFTFV